MSGARKFWTRTWRDYAFDVGMALTVLAAFAVPVAFTFWLFSSIMWK